MEKVVNLCVFKAIFKPCFRTNPRILNSGRTYPAYYVAHTSFCPLLKLKAKLPQHNVDSIFNYSGKPCPFCSIMKMTQSKILLNYITFFRNLFIPVYFIFGQFCCGCILSHDTIPEIIQAQKVTVWFSKIAFISINSFKFLFGMKAINRKLWQVWRIVVGSRSNDCSQKPLLISTEACSLSP